MKSIEVMTLFLLASLSALGFPQYLQRFSDDPLSSPNFRNRCATCHVNRDGGGPSNEFGSAFAVNNFSITPELRARFPERFQYPVQRLDARTEIHYSDAAGKTAVLKRDGVMTLIDPAHPTPSLEGAAAASPAAEPPAALSEWDRPLQASTRWINLPQPAAIRRNDLNFLIQHRFSAPLFAGSAAQLFGLDSPANIFFGFDYGVADRVLASVYRSRSERTVELDITGELWRQGEGAPVSLGGRIGVEGRDNFRDFYSPHLQLVAQRRFGRRVEVLVAPAVVFNSQDNRLFFLRDFAADPDEDFTANLGLGLSLKLSPTVSLLGEYVPRLAGFRGYFHDRPAVSVALQKQTFRHVFSLVLSTSTEMGPAGFGPNIGRDASDTANRLKIGFNIFRKLR